VGLIPLGGGDYVVYQFRETFGFKSVKKTTSQNVWPRIHSNELINELMNYNRASAVLKNRVVFWKHDTSSASERVFPGFFGNIFGCSTLSKKRRFSTQEFTRFLSTVSSQRRTTRLDVSFQT